MEEQHEYKRKVAFVSPHCVMDLSNGAATATRDALRVLAEEGFGCQAFCGTRSDTPDEGPIQESLARLGVNYEIRRAKIGPYEGRLLFVADGRVRVTLLENASTPGRLTVAEAQTFLTACDIFLRTNRPDVVWTYGGDPVSLAVHVLARRLDIPVVFSMHDFGFTDGEAFQAVDYAVVSSQWARMHYRQSLGLACQVLPNIVNWQAAETPNRGPRYLTFVNPVESKGLCVFARIARELARRRADIPILVAQGRGRADALRAQDLGLAPHLAGQLPTLRSGNGRTITTTPFEPDPRRFCATVYSMTKLLLMPSLGNEPFARAAKEAMLNGIPVLASNRGALPETISDAGFLFDIPAKYTPGSREIPSAEEVEPWVQTIIRLWDDAAQYEGCSRAARERAKRWRPDRLAPIYREFFAGITRQRGAPLAPRGLAARDELQEAEQICRRVLQSEPNNAGALHRLGVIRHQQGDQEAAIELIGRAIALDPQNALYRNDYGLPLVSLRRFGEALDAFRAALKIDPQYAQALANLGALLIVTDRADLAVGALREAIALAPDRAEAHLDLGVAYTALGHDEAALASIRRVLDLQPRHLNALMRCAALLMKLGREDEAVPFYERAMAERPSAETHIDFGNLLFGLGQRDLAIDQYRGAVALAPELAEAHFNVGIMLKDQGKIEEAATHYRRAVELKPDSAMMHGNLLLCEQYRADATPAGLAAAHAEWDRRHAASLRAAWRPFSHDGETEHALRVGFVSCNFRQHPVGLLTIRAIEGLKQQACEVVCYSDVARRIDYQSVSPAGRTDRQPGAPQTDSKSIPHQTDCKSVLRPGSDAITERFIAAADRWVETAELSDEQLAERIRDDRIDILFDLGGHLDGNRLLVFARKPAPIQVKWVGYPGSSGLTAMDYLLADRWQVEAGGDANYPEKVLRLPDGYVCFDPPADAPEVGPLPAWGVAWTSQSDQSALTPTSLTPCPSPAGARGEPVVTFGSFNNPAKINPGVVAAWAEILRRVPESRLMLKYRGFDQPGTRRHYAELFAARGIAPERLEMVGWSPRARMLADYNRLDLVLDPFPYSGGITTCEALWMGVPVITLPGKTFAGRHSLSHLSNVGFTDTLARDVADYVELAVQLAHDLPRLAKWRVELRGQVARSPLCDGPRFAANLMKALHAV